MIAAPLPPDEDTAAALARAAALLDDPASWERILPIRLGQGLGPCLLAYGVTPRPELRTRVAALYDVTVRRCRPPSRLRAVDATTGAVGRGIADPDALLIAVERERDVLIIAAAARSFAFHQGDADEDLLSGVRRLLRLDDGATEVHTRIGVITAILDFGDERVIPLVRGRWRRLDAEHRPELTAVAFGLATTARVAFMLDWLGDTDSDADREAIADLLEAMPGLGSPGIVRVTHQRPDEPPPPGIPPEAARNRDNPEEWSGRHGACTWVEPRSFRDESEQLEPRLAPIAALPDGARRIESILTAWRASTETLATMLQRPAEE